MNEFENQIINAIFHQGVVHYSDIEKITGKSSKTIAKYLTNIDSEVSKYGVGLIRKRNVGLYFEGDTEKLEAAMGDGSVSSIRDSKRGRQLHLLSKLLLAKRPQPIQSLADSIYVSRSTFETDLKDLKLLLNKYGATLATSNDGIQVVADERVRRRLMAELLNMYWGQPAYIGNRRKDAHELIKIPSEMSEFFSSETLDKVLKVLDEFERVTSIQLSDYEYQSLAVHLVIAIERIRRNETLQSGLDRVPLESGTEALVAIIESRFNLRIPEDEEQYINIHILAAERVTSDSQSVRSSKGDSIKSQAVADFLRNNLKESDETLVRNLTLHLVPTLKRISLGLKLRNPYISDTKRYFPLAYNRAVDLGLKLKQEFNVDLNDDELAFIALHIEAYIERTHRKVTAVLVCSTGLGTARLLEQRIRKYFADKIDVKRVVSVQELRRSAIPEDMVISTVNIQVVGKPFIMVPPFLDERGAHRIDDLVDDINSDQPSSRAFMGLLRKRLITFADAPMDKEETIRIMGDQIERTGFGKHGISDAAVKRESLASTAINTVAIPHAPIEFVQKPSIGILINPEGIRWDTHNVKIVFFLAMNQEIKPYVDQIYGYFNNVLEDKQLLAQLEKAGTPEEVIQILGGDLNVG